MCFWFFNACFHQDGEKCKWLKYDDLTIEDIYHYNSKTVYHSLSKAKQICEEMAVMCSGVVKDDEGENYKIYQNSLPHHREDSLEKLIQKNGGKLPGGALGNDLRKAQLHVKQLVSAKEMQLKEDRFDHENDPSKGLSKKEFTEYLLPYHNYTGRPTAFVKHCKGIPGAYKAVPKPLQVSIAYNISKWVEDYYADRYRHFFSFEFQFEVLLKPSKHLYYKDNKHFEAQLSKGQNFYTFHWPNGHSPNFLDPDTPREYTFRTGDFSIPNIPGCYAVESKIQDTLSQPYFQWNWWFEITTGDREVDARTREAYWRKLMEDTAAMKKAEQHRTETRLREAAQIKREREFQRKMSELHNKELKIQENHLRNNGVVLNKEEQNEVNVQGIKERVDSLKEDKEAKLHELLSENGGKIEVYDPQKDIPLVKQAVQQLTTVQVKQRKHKAFHASLPKHLKNEINL